MAGLRRIHQLPGAGHLGVELVELGLRLQGVGLRQPVQRHLCDVGGLLLRHGEVLGQAGDRRCLVVSTTEDGHGGVLVQDDLHDGLSSRGAGLQSLQGLPGPVEHRGVAGGQELLKHLPKRPPSGDEFRVQGHQGRGEGGFQLRGAENLGEDLVDLVAALDLDLDAETVLQVSQVGDVGDTGDDTLSSQVAQPRLWVLALAGAVQESGDRHPRRNFHDGEPGLGGHHRAAHGQVPATGVHVLADSGLGADHLAAGAPVRAGHDVEDVVDGGIGVVVQQQGRVNRLDGVVLGEGGRPTFADTDRTETQQCREPRREVDRLHVLTVVGGLHRHSALGDFLHHGVPSGGEPGLRVAVGGRFVTRGDAESTDTLDQGDAAVGLGQRGQRPVHRGLTVRVVGTGGRTGELGRLARLGAGEHLVLVHRPEETLGSRLDSGEDAGQRAFLCGVQHVRKVLGLQESGYRHRVNSGCDGVLGDGSEWLFRHGVASFQRGGSRHSLACTT